MAGIRILSRDEWLKDSRGPYLDVFISVLGTGDIRGFAYAIQTALRQVVVLRTGKLCMASTWDDSSIGTASPNSLRSAVRESVKDRVNSFLNNWLTANPKK